MDKDFDERMAPALHTTNHDSASEAIKNSLKHSLSSNSNPDSSPDQNIYEHINGMCHISETMEGKEPKKGSHLAAMEYNAHPILPSNLVMSISTNGAAGDHAITIDKKETSVTSSVPEVSGMGDGSGMLSNKTTNGWPVHPDNSTFQGIISTVSTNAGYGDSDLTHIKNIGDNTGTVQSLKISPEEHLKAFRDSLRKVINENGHSHSDNHCFHEVVSTKSSHNPGDSANIDGSGKVDVCDGIAISSVKRDQTKTQLENEDPVSLTSEKDPDMSSMSCKDSRSTPVNIADENITLTKDYELATVAKATLPVNGLNEQRDNLAPKSTDTKNNDNLIEVSLPRNLADSTYNGASICDKKKSSEILSSIEESLQPSRNNEVNCATEKSPEESNTLSLSTALSMCPRKTAAEITVINRVDTTATKESSAKQDHESAHKDETVVTCDSLKNTPVPDELLETDKILIKSSRLYVPSADQPRSRLTDTDDIPCTCSSQAVKSDFISNSTKPISSSICQTNSNMEGSFTTQTTLVCDHNTSILSHCVHNCNHSGESKTLNGSSSPKNHSETPLKVQDFLGLAHGLVTGNHMQNLPPKLTNTLHELAASLKRGEALGCEPESLELKQEPVGQIRQTSAAPEKVYADEPVGKMLNAEDVKTQQRQQFAVIAQNRLELEKRMSSLKERLNKVRTAGVYRYTRKQMSLLASNKPDDSCTDIALCDKRCVLFWKKIHEQIESPEHRIGPRSKVKRENAKPLKSILKHQSPNLCERTGILKKELLAMRVRFDPDLTDSSSDEELDDVPEVLRKRMSGNQIPVSQSLTDTTPKLPPKQSLSVKSTPLWKWANERSSIARRWTWLHGQVSELQYKIQQHSDLYQQLRAAKGEVAFCDAHNSPAEELASANGKVLDQVSMTNEAEPHLPSNITHLVNNIKQQSSSVLENLRPLSVENSPVTAKHTKDREPLKDVTSQKDDRSCTAARTRALMYPLRRRKIVRASDAAFLAKKPLKPPTIFSESSIMGCNHHRLNPFLRDDGKPIDPIHASMVSRAAQHDHSYHKILSRPEDIPVSLRLNGHMMTNNKRTAGKLKRVKEQKRNKQKPKDQHKRAKDDRSKIRQKSATVVLERADKLIRSVSALHRNSSMEDRSSILDQKRRRGSVQLMSDFNKRHRMTSFESDAENVHRSDGGTPTPESSLNNPQYQAVLKRKRAAEQAYDINNIVIPHGLTTTRIEKLQYKEILTPGWRAIKDGEKEKDEQEAQDDNADLESKDQCDDGYKDRHDRYEILEKKKYMAYMEWNINKKNGTRSMSRANMPPKSPLEQQSPSYFYPSSLRSSPTAQFSPELPSPASPEAPAVVRSRRSSSDPSVLSTAADRHRVFDSVSSDDGSLFLRENSNYDSWDLRTFPLNDADYTELIKEPVIRDAKPTKLSDSEADIKFRPILHKPLGPDTNTAPKHKTTTPFEPSSTKRRRLDSQRSTLSRDDERLSDDSNASSIFTSVRVRQSKSESSNRAPSPVASSAASTTSQPRRRKPPVKDQDFLFYSELDPESDSNPEEDSDAGSMASEDNKPLASLSRKASDTSAGGWISKAISRESTPRRSGTSDDEVVGEGSPTQKAPLVLKLTKR
ncbi:uncharacterized protein LOC143471117 isoform X2 [Clavelina lepadiformis]|uniref:uncharacterized protein LOC143471117 isoform X2 n=1 Tax=Clavelina lepadiformis TaxID=159417 RepID=UPI004042C6C7